MVQVDVALTAIVHGYEHDGRKFKPIGLDDFSLNGTRFNTFLSNIRDEVSAVYNPDHFERALRSDTILKSASQVCKQWHGV